MEQVETKVDVLAVLADYSAQHGDPEDFEQARAAIAELIEAMRKAEDRLGVLIESDNEDHGGAAPEDVAAWEACNAAHARVGGAA